MNTRKLMVLAMGACLAFAAMAENYTANWSNDKSITIGGVTYSDLLNSAVWGVDPTTLPTADGLVLNWSANISMASSATLSTYFIASSANAQHNVNLNGNTLTATARGLRNMTSGARITFSNGTLNLGVLLWPDRSSDGAVKTNNVFTATGAGTTLDVQNLYFGYNMGDLPGAGCGNKVIVTNGAFAAANVKLAWYQSFSGEPNGLYITGAGTVFSNKNANSCLEIKSAESANSFSNEFVVADGAIVKGMDSFSFCAARNLNYGEGHLLAFRGANTAHTFRGSDSTLGLSHRLEVDGAAVTSDNVTINNYGILTVKNGGSIVGKIGQYGTILLSGEGSRIVASAFNMNQADLPPLRTYVTDGASLSFANRALQFGANGCTNASLYVRSGGKVRCGSANVGYATTNLTCNIAPYCCVLEVDGIGSVVSNDQNMVVGTAYSGAEYFTGCGTNGHDNVIRVKNGGKIYNNPGNSVIIGFVCSSNALEVLDGGLLECGELHIGRAGAGTVGPFRARDVAFDNRCVVAGGTIESTGLVSFRGNNSLCHVTNGVIHTTGNCSLDCEKNTGCLLIAGTNSLVKGDLSFSISSAGAKVGFALPKEGYARAPIQSDNAVSFHETTVVSFIPPVEVGRIADSYTLAQVPESGTLDVPAALLSSMRTAIADLGEQDERFAKYRVKVAVEDGYRRLVARKPGGLILSFR